MPRHSLTRSALVIAATLSLACANSGSSTPTGTAGTTGTGGAVGGSGGGGPAGSGGMTGNGGAAGGATGASGSGGAAGGATGVAGAGGSGGATAAAVAQRGRAALRGWQARAAPPRSPTPGPTPSARWPTTRSSPGCPPSTWWSIARAACSPVWATPTSMAPAVRRSRDEHLAAAGDRHPAGHRAAAESGPLRLRGVQRHQRRHVPGHQEGVAAAEQLHADQDAVQRAAVPRATPTNGRRRPVARSR